MPETIFKSVKLTTISCGGCGGTYAINERYREQKQEEGGSWHCPYCRVSWGFRGNEVTRLKKKLACSIAAHDQTKAELRETEMRRRGEKAAKTKIKNRIAAGVCPCCNRTFQNLARHMKGQHPGYADA